MLHKDCQLTEVSLSGDWVTSLASYFQAIMYLMNMQKIHSFTSFLKSRGIVADVITLREDRSVSSLWRGRHKYIYTMNQVAGVAEVVNLWQRGWCFFFLREATYRDSLGNFPAQNTSMVRSYAVWGMFQYISETDSLHGLVGRCPKGDMLMMARKPRILAQPRYPRNCPFTDVALPLTTPFIDVAASSVSCDTLISCLLSCHLRPTWLDTIEVLEDWTWRKPLDRCW